MKEAKHTCKRLSSQVRVTKLSTLSGTHLVR